MEHRHFDKESIEYLDRNTKEWTQFVNWQKERILERLKRYNNVDTAKIQLSERGDLTSYQHYKITTVSKYLLKALENIKAGAYGICTNCRKEIPVQRLLLVPGALTCMDCENHKQ